MDAKSLITSLGLEDRIEAFVREDATRYRIPEESRPDITVSETMASCLRDSSKEHVLMPGEFRGGESLQFHYRLGEKPGLQYEVEAYYRAACSRSASFLATSVSCARNPAITSATLASVMAGSPYFGVSSGTKPAAANIRSSHGLTMQSSIR